MTGLRVEGLHVDLAGRRILEDVTVGVSAGELVGLLGPNGAGKTTLLRSVLGLVRARAGRVTVDGERIRRRSLIGYVPQRHEFAWDFPISVERAVLTGRTGHRAGTVRRAGVADWRAVGEALDRVQLGDLRTRPVGELSGGQRQRVLVARALALVPSVLLLDEPFTGLDAPTQELLSDLFIALAQEGRALLMTTHDLLGARSSCSRLILLDRVVIADGPPADLRDEDLWMRTFGVGRQSPLLKLLRVA